MASVIRSTDHGDGTYTQYFDDGTWGRYTFSDGSEVGRGRSSTIVPGAAHQNNAEADRAARQAQKELDDRNKKAKEDADAAQKNAAEWDKYLKGMADLMAKSAGARRKELEMQYADAQKNRNNAWKIAEYQTRVQAEVQRERLAFDKDKWKDEYNLQRWGLSGKMDDGSYTDQAQQWRSQLGLQAAQIGAQLSQSPENWFEAGAFYDELAENGYLGDAASTLRTTLSSRGGSQVAPQTNSLPKVITNTQQGQNAPTQVPYALSGTTGQWAHPGTIDTLASMTPEQRAAHRESVRAEVGAYAPNSGVGPSINDQRRAFADEAFTLAQNANQWAPDYWDNLGPTKQKLLQSAWKSKGLNPDDVLFKFQTMRPGQYESGRAA